MSSPAKATAPSTDPSGLRKAAVMMILLGDKAASDVFRYLAQTDVQRLTAEVASIDSVSPEEAVQILEEYNKLAMTQEYLAKGGPIYAEKLLVKAFGEEESKRLLEQSLQSQNAEPLDMEALRRIDPQQLAKMLQDEHPQTIALVLAHLGSRFSSAVLGVVPEAVRAQVVERLAKMRQLSGETVQKFMMILQKKIGGMGKQQNRLAYGGINAVASLLNNMDSVASKAILEAIEQNDPKLALSIRDVLFTFEDLLTVPLNSIREILGQVEKKSLAISLKGASENLRNYIFKAMSQRAVEMLKEDMEALGPMRAKEVAKAQHEIVMHLRQLESEGKITLRNEEQDALVV
ncbi:MAG: flagellar motor switch protein FliG [Terriglobia bacterium]